MSIGDGGERVDFPRRSTKLWVEVIGGGTPEGRLN